MITGVPVLFLVFNRPKATCRVFEKIKQAEPSKLYIAADGPREKNSDDQQKCEKVRQIVSNIDWDCEVKTLFRDKNLGCKIGVSRGINWFFEHEEMGIILEDDCVPSKSFFRFCSELLDRYKNDLRVWHISGYNHFPNRVHKSDYFYSKIPGIWGWATWRNRWKEYDIEVEDLQILKSKIENYFKYESIGKHWVEIFEKLEGIDTWDYQWTYTIMKNNGLCIRPSKNLVSNIGFGKNATHTTSKNKIVANNSYTEIKKNKFVAPVSYLSNEQEDLNFYKKRLKQKNIVSRLFEKLFL